MSLSAAIAGTSIATPLLPRPSAVLALAAAVGSLPPLSTVRSDPHRPTPRALVRRPRRTRRKSLTDVGHDGFSGDGDGDDGPFGGGGGGKGWGFGGGGGGGDGDGSDWEDSGRVSPPDPAFGFVYEVVSFVVLSNCAHFAYKRIGRFLTGKLKVVPGGLVQL